MSQKIEIPVAVKLDATRVQSTVKDMGKSIQDAAKVKLEPVSDASLRKLKEAQQAYQTLLKVDQGFARRVRNSGQSGREYHELDFNRLFTNPAQRERRRSQINSYIDSFDPNAPHDEGGGGGRRPRRPGGWGGMAMGVAQSGLRAAGPVGGVAANSLGAGMSGGMGAGLMGLVGGIAALGVGKLIGAITANIEKAENNNVAYDRLKRTLGDVNVSFSSLKKTVMDTGDGLKLTYDEAGQLAQGYTKAGNLRGTDYRSLPEELGLGVGLSRAYGLDPSAGVNTLGAMRGTGVMNNTQETRSMALLIGETIAKSDAFAKADEVMEAISSFAVAQTRQSLTVANTAGYAGMFSSMVGSGIAGMDPAGASNILSRMNSSLSAGGAKGEASQFFTAMVGNRMGLDPLQTQILREGGMFANNDSAFGDKSVYARYMGKTGPGGSQDFLGATRGMIEEKYGGDSDYQKMMRANAFANHTGLNMNQSMAMLSLKPNQMGQMQKYAGDMTTLSASGINNMALSLFGNDDQRSGIRDSLLARSDLKSEDRESLHQAFGPNGSAEQQKEVLAKLSAQYEQERTTGSDIRDSKALLDNIKTTLADKMVPIMEASRTAMLYLAGGKDGVTRAQMEAKLAKNEAKSALDSSLSGIDSKRLANEEAQERVRNDKSMSSFDKFSEISRLEAERKALNKESTAATQAYNNRLQDIDNPARYGPSAPAGGAAKAGGGGGSASTSTGSPVAGAGSGTGPNRVKNFVKEHGPLADKLSKELGVPSDAILGQWGLETGWGKSVIPGTNNLGNIKDFSGKGPTARDNMTGSVDAYRQYESTEGFGADFKKLLSKKRYAGALGTDNARDYFAGLKQGGYAEDPNYVSSGVKASNMAARARVGTAIPDPKSTQAPGNDVFSKGTSAWPGGQAGFSVDPLTVFHQDSSGRQIAPPQELNFTQKAPAASFADRFSF
ncbi:glycoside hydrolase family 73 protein [Tardiphaga sp. 862_B3_N1_1]|uniref:glycoside hydrolase family 73 protein n=1 Tax=Tardiphaga sp. 862_B3_N1_1 TaxID=3240763 RepID=UPI003F8A06CF